MTTNFSSSKITAAPTAVVRVLEEIRRVARTPSRTFFGHEKGAFTGATQDNRGHWQAADRGTLFLDEVGDLPLELQPKILRAPDDGVVKPVGSTKNISCDLRIVAATNIDLEQKVEAGTFRRDLFARLAGYVIESIPLRERARTSCCSCSTS